MKPNEGNARLNRCIAQAFFFVLSVTFLPGCLFHGGRRGDDATSVNLGDQPDKILFEKAIKEIVRGRYDVARLTLQTLINTYPDSEYLAKAKLAIADSYYKEGGVSGLTQAEIEYKDFITFFPTAPEAPTAQFRAGMAHYRLMGKADRDRTEAKIAEAEFKEFLLKYPDSPLMPRVKRRLRQVQEVLAQSEYRIAAFYFMRGANQAARSRFQEIADRYPDFSHADSALWYLAQSLERLKTPNAAVPYYARIITDHPFSPRVEEAKARLTTMRQPIPRPTRAMLARAQADAAPRPRRDVLQKLGAMMSNSPDVSATRRGPVRLGAPQPTGVEVAQAPEPGAGGNTIVVQPVSDASLKTGQPVDSNPGDSAAASESTVKPQENSNAPKAQEGSTTSNSGHSSETPPSTKKKGRLRLFKKLVKPF